MKFRQLWGLCLCLLMALLVGAGCGSDSEGEGGTEVASGGGDIEGFIQVIQPGVHPYPAGENKGLEVAAEDLGLDLRITQSDFDPAKDLANVQTAISNGAKAIIIQPNSSEGIVPAIDEANEAGICTIALLTNPGGDGSTVYNGMKGFIGWVEYEGGRLMGESMAKGLDGKGKVVIIGGAQESNASLDRVRGATDVWEESYPDIEVIASQPADYDTEKARKVMTDFVQRFGDEIDGVLVITNNMATAAADVVASSLADDEVVISSFGGSDEVANYIRDGRIYSDLAFAPIDEGRRAVELAKECMEGNTDPVFVPATELDSIAALEDDGYVLNADNVDSFETQW